MVNTHVDIKRLDASRIPHLEILHKAVYGVAPRRNYFSEKYDTTYTGTAYIGFIAYNADKMPVAYYGVLPCMMQYEGVTFLAAQSGDTMTHPEFRNKGLFVELAHLTYALCRENGIRLVYGFPNQKSRHGLLQKLDWITTEDMHRFNIPVRGFPLQRLMKHGLRNTYENYCRRILKKYLLSQNGLLLSAARDGFGGVDRSDRFLAYKKYSPSFVVQLAGARVWFRIRQDLTIGDMDCTAENFTAVMRQLKKIANRLGLPEINFQLSPGTRLHQLFTEYYTPHISFPVCFKDLGAAVPLEKIKFSFADIDVF